MGVGVATPSSVGVAAASVGSEVGVLVPVAVGVAASAVRVDSGVEVEVAVKVGSGVDVPVGMEVETRETGLPPIRSVRRQACRNANKLAKLAPLINFLLFIYILESKSICG